MQPNPLILRNPQIRQRGQRIKGQRPQPPIRKHIVRYHHKIPTRLHHPVDLFEDRLLRFHKVPIHPN
ncbi:MAG TPA: hypothetical protein VI816_04285, partial [Candidatus Bathyarchaeia archaeon]|nr:hypothetical protein [Candidatus Bathyarchaeia archaeon]